MRWLPAIMLLAALGPAAARDGLFESCQPPGDVVRRSDGCALPIADTLAGRAHGDASVAGPRAARRFAQAAPAPGVARGSRVALVIGNAGYSGLPGLTNPRADAGDVAEALGRLGFVVSLALDATHGEMESRLAAFRTAARSADAAVVFFAGHGLQHQGVNYLVPIDATLTSEGALQRLFKVEGLLGGLQRAKGARILLLDAGRDGEAIKRIAPATRPAGRAPQPLDGVLIAFATQPGAVAPGGPGRNSPFTAALLRNLPVPGQDVRVLLTRVRADVLSATQGRQRPDVADSLDEPFSFN